MATIAERILRICKNNTLIRKKMSTRTAVFAKLFPAYKHRSEFNRENTYT